MLGAHTDFFHDTFLLYDGYRYTWLCGLYLLGGGIGKEKVFRKVKPKNAFIGFIIASCSAFAGKILTESYYYKSANLIIKDTFFVSYTSPFVVVASVSLLLIFVNSRTNDTLPVRKLTQSIFGVYIIHMNPIVREAIINDKYPIYLNSNPVVMICKIIITSFVIMVLCWLISMVLTFLVDVIWDKVCNKLFIK